MSTLLEHSPIYLVAHVLPPSAFGGALKTSRRLTLAPSPGPLPDAGLSAEHVDAVVFGNVAQTSAGAIYLARHVGLRAGLPIEVPALTVNRLCGSGFRAVVSGAHEILMGDAESC